MEVSATETHKTFLNIKTTVILHICMSIYKNTDIILHKTDIKSEDDNNNNNYPCKLIILIRKM